MPNSADIQLEVAPLPEKVSDREWQTRVDLAAAFRVAYHFGWNRTINNHISARVPGEPDHFVMNPTNVGWNDKQGATV